MIRMCQVINVKPDRLEEYIDVHDNIWPEILQILRDCNIRNYSIYLWGNHTLIATFEYVGDDMDSDWAKMVAESKMVEWWDLCTPMQTPVPEVAEGEWWYTLKEVFHMD